MTRIIYYKRPEPMDDECVYITTDVNLDTELQFGDDIEILSDRVYNIELDPQLPLDHELIVD